MKSKTNVAGDAATPAPADVLAQFETLHDALTASHSQIPALLARERTCSHDLGLAEARGDSNVGDLRAQLDDITRQREASVRRRAASSQGVLDLEPMLQADRAASQAERQRIAAGIVGEFSQRWRQACNTLAALRGEAEVLARALGTTVPTPPPYQPFAHSVDGSLRLRPLAASEPAPAPTLPANLSALITRLDSLDAALARVSAIRQSRTLDSRHYDLCKVRGTPVEYLGTFLVTASFDSLIDGLSFEVGILVDSSLIGAGQLARLTTGKRYLRPAHLETATSAA
jgi:hypothetical protein